MARMTGRSRFPIDASLILRAEAAVQISVDTDLPVQKFAQTGAVWQNPADPVNGSITLAGHVSQMSDTLSIDIYVADDAAKTNPVLVDSVTMVSGEWFAIPIDETSLLAQNPTKAYWFATLNVGGSTHTATVFAYLAPDSPI